MTDARTNWSLAWRAARSAYGIEWCYHNCPGLYALAVKLYRLRSAA